jgi:hypothetical protein
MPRRFNGAGNGKRHHHHDWRTQELMGKSFMDRQHEVVLRIGSDAWTREEMVSRLKCANLNAARLLTKAAEKLNVEDTRQMAARVSLEDLFAVKHVGITTVYVWLCVLDAVADQDPYKWIDREDEKIVTLSTEKLRVKKAQDEQRRAARAQHRQAVNH